MFFNTKIITKNPDSRNSPGFSLAEILVFMALISVMVVILLSVLASFYRSRSTARKLSALQDATTFIYNDLTQEIHWSDAAEISPHQDELILVQVQADGEIKQVDYWVDETGQLYKNDAPLTTAKVVTNRFEIINRAEPDQVPCLEIQLGLEYADSQPKIIAEQKTTISLRKKKMELVND
jgi:type II secretory pathway pseudopilin PulG